MGGTAVLEKTIFAVPFYFASMYFLDRLFVKERGRCWL